MFEHCHFPPFTDIHLKVYNEINSNLGDLSLLSRFSSSSSSYLIDGGKLVKLHIGKLITITTANICIQNLRGMLILFYSSNRTRETTSKNDISLHFLSDSTSRLEGRGYSRCQYTDGSQLKVSIIFFTKYKLALIGCRYAIKPNHMTWN